MVTIDDKGNKVNCWVEHRFDTTTNEVVEVKHATILAEADDEEHWLSRTTYEPLLMEGELTIGNVFIYASEEVLASIEHLLGMMRKMLGSHHTPATEIALPQLMRALVGMREAIHERRCEGQILQSAMMPCDTLALLVDCDVASAEALRDALFAIFPEIGYIEIEY